MELHYTSLATDIRILEMIACLLVIGLLRRLRPTP